MTALALRDYQQADVDAIRSAMRHARSVLYVAPTGSGKTVLFTYIARAAAAKGNRILILVHRAELIRQTAAALETQSVPYGVIAAGYPPEPLPNVQIASVQTLVRRIPSIHPPHLIVVDEAHHSVAGSWRKILTAFPHAHILGVTATPVRLDGRGLGVTTGGWFESLIDGPSVNDLIERGWLARPVIYVPPPKVDLEGVKITAGDYNREQLVLRLDKPSITGDAVAHYRRICPASRAIAFCASIAHARHVTDEFTRAGYRWSLLVGSPTMGEAARKAATEWLADGRLDGVCTVDLVSEGYDVPAVEAAILLRPTQSLGLCLQQIGRALRPSPGKRRAIILDHVGNVLAHGLPQDDREWTLDGERAKPRNAEPNPHIRQCPICYMVHRPAPACPGCGHRYAIVARRVDERAGELRELTPAEIERQRVIRDRRREEGRARTREDLQALALARGYKPGWVEHRLRARAERGR